MYAGHFSTAILLYKIYPNVIPFVFTVGVGFLDIVFGILAYFGLETISENPHTGLIGVNLHCNYSHSLAGSAVLSVLYGIVTGSFVPAFVASFSHFVEDWTVHNKNLFLDPYSNILVGGTSLWSKYPIGAYYLEGALCFVIAALTSRDIFTVMANLYVCYLHWGKRPSVPGGFPKVARLPEPVKRTTLFKAFTRNFGSPAIILGTLLFKNYYDVKYN